MKKITMKMEGVTCGMCENHSNEAIRAAFPVQSIVFSRRKGTTEPIAQADISTEAPEEVQRQGWRRGLQ